MTSEVGVIKWWAWHRRRGRRTKAEGHTEAQEGGPVTMQLTRKSPFGLDVYYKIDATGTRELLSTRKGKTFRFQF